MSARVIVWSAIILSIICGVFSYKSQRQDLPRAVTESEEDMSELPDGVESSWVAYVSKRLESSIQREGGNIKVYAISLISPDPTHYYFSQNYPYKIDCNAMGTGIDVTFGVGDEGVVFVPITGALSSDFSNEPVLAVRHDSVAARNLDAKLCGVVAAWMTDIVR